MTIHELLNQLDMGDIGPKERRRRVYIAFQNLEGGHEVRGVIDGKATSIGLGADGNYIVTQTWTLRRETPEV